MEASTAQRGAATTTLRQPAYGEYTEHPEVEAQPAGADQEAARDDLGRWARWPFLLVLALLEIAWLVALAYVAHRFVVSAILG
jgi:hypothetical protein